MSIKDILSNIFPDGKFDSIPINDIVKSQRSITKVFSSMPDKNYKLDKAQAELFDMVENTQTNIFIQGQAGTGKSTFINYLKKQLMKHNLFFLQILYLENVLGNIFF